MKHKTTAHKTATHHEFTPVQKIIKQTVEFARHKPLVLIGIAVVAVIALSWFINSLRAAEVLPEVQEAQAPAKPVIINNGQSMLWLGMELTAVSKIIRKEFKIPGNIKGIFVSNEGTLEAAKYGVKTGDVIVSVSRRAVPTTREFVKVANNVRYTSGILLDIYRDGKSLYLTIPFAYQYGPLVGPYKGSWQLGSPVLGQAFQYGPVVK